MQRSLFPPPAAHRGNGDCGLGWFWNGFREGWEYNQYVTYANVYYPDGSRDHWRYYDHYYWEPYYEDYLYWYSNWRHCYAAGPPVS